MKSPSAQNSRKKRRKASVPCPAGTSICKMFNGVQHHGQVHKFYPNRNVCFVRHDDGDSEEFHEQELKRHLLPSKNKSISSFAPTRPHIHQVLIPNSASQFAFHLDQHRLQRSRRQHFHMLDTASFRNNPNTVHLQNQHVGLDMVQSHGPSEIQIQEAF